MTDGARWGLTIPLMDRRLAGTRELIEALPRLGYADVWSAEVSGADAFLPLALAAEWSSELRLGTAIVPVYTRGPATLAMSAATLADAAPGRVVLGIGASSPAIVERWNAGSFDKPYQRTRDMLRFLRKALTGEKIKESYETFEIKGFRLDLVPAVQPKIVLAALRPGMLRLAAKEADGAITNWLAPEDVPKIREVIGPDVELIARVFVCVNDNADEVRALGRWMIASYLTVPVYAAFHDWLGRDEILRPMHEAWAAGDRKSALEVIPDEVVDALIIHGDAATCRARLSDYVKNGLDTPVLAIVPGGPQSTAEAVRLLAPVKS